MFGNFSSIIQNIQNVGTMDKVTLLSYLFGPTYFELIVFTIGMFFYALFVWYFYKKLSKRDIFELNLSKYDLPEVKWKGLKKGWSSFLYVLKYWVLMPFYVIFWFFVLSVFLFFLAKNVSVRQIALVSISLVATVRVTSYVKEELSQDLAKLMPLALLVIFLTDPTFFSWDVFMTRLNTLPNLWRDLIQFITFTILLEWVLRIIYGIKNRASRRKVSKEVPVENAK